MSFARTNVCFKYVNRVNSRAVSLLPCKRRTSGFTRTRPLVKVGKVNLGGRHLASVAPNVSFQEEPVKQVDDVSVKYIDEALSQLDYEAKRLGRVWSDSVTNVFEQVKKLGKASSIQSLYLIRCCGALMRNEIPSKRTELVQEIWSKLQDLGIPIDASHYNSLLKVYLENEYDFSPTDFLSAMEQKGVQPNRVTYQRLIERFCESGDLTGASAVLEYMKEKGMAINEAVFNSLIKGHAKTGDFEGAKNMLEIMRNSKLSPSADTYCVLACCYAEKGNIEQIQSTIAEAQGNGAFISDKMYMQVIYKLASAGFEEHIDQIFSGIKDLEQARQDSANIILDLMNKGLVNIAFRLVLKIANVIPFQNGINLFVKRLVSSGMPFEEVVTYCADIKSKGLNDFVLCVAAKAAMENQDIEAAIKYFQELQNKGMPVRSFYFWPIFAIHNKTKNEHGIWATLKIMYDLGLPADMDTYLDYVFPFVSTSDPKPLLCNIKSTGQSDNAAVNPLFYFYCGSGDLKNAAYLCSQHTEHITSIPSLQILASHYYPSKEADAALIQILQHIYENTDTEADGGIDIYGEFFMHLLQHNNLPKNLLKEAHNQGIILSRSSADALCEKIGRNDSVAIQIVRSMQFGAPLLEMGNRESRGLHPRDMDQASLEKHLQGLRAAGDSTRATLRSLLNLYCRNRDLSKVIETKNELESQGFIFTPASYAVMINVFVAFSNLEEAMKLKKRLDEEYPEFKLDSVKAIDYVGLLLKSGKIEEAIEVMKKDCVEINFLGNRDAVLRSIKRLFAAASDSGNVQLTNDIYNYMITMLNISSPPVQLVECLINVYLVRDDLDQAIAEYKSIAMKYRIFPCRNTLFKKCIMANDAEKLQIVLDLTTMYGGKHIALPELALCFIETGNIQQARRVFQTLGGKAEIGYLEDLCRKLFRQNKFVELEQFVAVTKDLTHIDRDKLYFFLLQLHAQNNDYQKALEMWNSLQEENVQPSVRTLRLVAELLERNDQPIPFVVPHDNSFLMTGDKVAEEIVGNFDDDLVRKLRASLNSGDVDTVLNTLKEMKKGHVRSLSLDDMSRIVDLLTASKSISEISNIVQVMSYLLEKARIIFRPLLEKYSEVGNVEIMWMLLDFLPDFTVKNINFNYYFHKAYINVGKQEELLSELEKNFNKNFKLFSFSGFQEMLYTAPHLEERAAKLVDRYEKEASFELPRRVLWVHHFIHENFEKANETFKQYPSLFVNIDQMMSSVLRTVRSTQNDIVGRKFLDIVKEYDMKQIAKERAFSCLFDTYVGKSKLSEAVELIKEAQTCDIPLSCFSEASVLNLKKALIEKNQPVPFEIQNESDDSSSDSDKNV